MRVLEEGEHRAVLLLEEAVGDVHAVVGTDPDEILIEGAVMDTAEAQTVADRGLATLGIRRDVGRIEQPDLLQAAIVQRLR